MNKQEIKKAINYIQNMDLSVFVDKEETCKVVEFITEILQQQLNGGWIPMSERYPKPKEYSEVWITNINECVSHAYFSDGNFRFDNYGGKVIAREWIIAWKPYAKPEPYKEVSMTEQQVLEWLYLDLEEIIDFDDKEDKDAERN